MKLDIKSFIGKRFNKLTIIEDMGKVVKSTYSVTCVKCKCDCGEETILTITSVKNGHIKSCGCYVLERLNSVYPNGGDRNTRLYHIWENIKQRCLNSKSIHYRKYGGRGIVICNEWLIYSEFKNWAQSNGYQSHLTIERDNVDGNYEPSNCRWVTNLEQQSNKRNSKKITFNGETLIISEWARRTGIEKGVISYRINNGWPLEHVFENRKLLK